jgi:hypothetical protein
MQIFNTLKYGNDLVELLIEGSNPYAKQHLNTQDVDAIRLVLPAGERIQAYAIGRVVGAGRGVWVVTEKSLLAFMPGHRPAAQAWALEQLSAFEGQKGKYGYTLRAECAGAAISMYGADHSLALMCQRAVAAHNKHTTFTGHASLNAADALQALQLITDAALRTQPAVMAGLTKEDGLMTLLNQVSSHGLILTDELAAIFERMKAPQHA